MGWFFLGKGRDCGVFLFFHFLLLIFVDLWFQSYFLFFRNKDNLIKLEVFL